MEQIVALSFIVGTVAFAALACMDVWDEIRERISRKGGKNEE